MERQSALISEALRLEDEGKLQAAIAVHKKIVELDPTEVRSINSIAGLYGKLADYHAELAWTDRAIAIKPGFAPAWVNRGNALALLSRPGEAKAAFNRAIELGDMLPEAYNGLAVLSENAGDWRDGVRYYRKAVRVDPEFEDGWFGLAADLANLKRFDEAEAALLRVLALNPQAKDAREMLKELEATNGSPGRLRRRPGRTAR